MAARSILASLDAGNVTAAEQDCRNLETLFPNHAEVHFLFALIHLRKREYDLASRRAGRALAMSPGNPGYLELDARIRLAMGHNDLALASYDAALRSQPDFLPAMLGKADLLVQLGRFAEAIPVYDSLLLRHPRHHEAFHNRGFALERSGRLHAAVGNYTRSILLRRNNPQALNNRGNAYFSLGMHERAVADYERAISLNPDYVTAYNNMANALVTLKRCDEAIQLLRKALELEPGYTAAQNNMAYALQKAGEYGIALDYLDRAVAADPGYAEAWNNRGHSLHKLRRFDEALDSFQRAIDLKPDYAEAIWNRGLVRLLQADMLAGWDDLEIRWRRPSYQSDPTPRDRPQWSGQDLNGKSITVFVEQGFGDMIQFSRYLVPMIEAGAQVTFAAPRIIHRLMASLSPDLRMVGSYSPAALSDYYCTLFSLPRIFRTTEPTIPKRVPYLHPEPELAEKWKRRLGAHGFKIAISWQGNPAGDVDQGRSIPLALLSGLARIPGVRLISIQYEHGLDQLDDPSLDFPVEVLEDFNTGQDGFLDTAAVMSCVDLVLTTDSAPAHLAGALGVPVWVMLMEVPDWRWLMGRTDSPWYPTMRLFRQERSGDWNGVVGVIEQELRKELRTASGATPSSQNCGE